MNDLRQFERFPLTLPVRAETFNSNKKQVFDFKTRDISASGVFLYTPEPFSKGVNFKLNLTVPNKRIKKLTGVESLIDCEGEVVRSTPEGVAIRFIRECQIMSLKGL